MTTAICTHIIHHCPKCQGKMEVHNRGAIACPTEEGEHWYCLTANCGTLVRCPEPPTAEAVCARCGRYEEASYDMGYGETVWTRVHAPHEEATDDR